MPDLATASLVNRPPRPLLSRVAESAFWMARYVERAEHVARVLLVNVTSLLDVGDLPAEVERQFWAGPLRIFLVDRMPEAQELLASPRANLGSRIARYLVLDEGNPNSIHACVTRARENARSIRENISAEMWENLNTLYWTLHDQDASGRFDESTTDLLKHVSNASLLFQGLSDQTLGHSQSWQFVQLGKYLERIDVTCRVIETKCDTLRAVDASLDHAERNMHLLSVVRSCCAVEAFRRNAADIEPDAIAAFLLLERNFPRSVCFCASRAREAATRISNEISPDRMDVAEGILGRLWADLQYAAPAEVAGSLLNPFLQKIQSATLDAAMAVRTSYFLK
ncbi:MAG TPA: alpha-E domain-containing protein [Tepidisphaeraceae bacterium]|jgi:uncharacterized alpha-E superfamily protein